MRYYNSHNQAEALKDTKTTVIRRSSYRARLMAAFCALGVCGVCPTLLHAAPTSTASTLGNRIHLTADSSSSGQGYLIYRNAHLVTNKGTTLDADQLRANLVKGTNALSTIVADGNVKAHMHQYSPSTPKAPERDYTVTADHALYDPKLDQITFTGSVVSTVTSALTDGPLVQSGDTAVVQLGKGPEYPQVHMTHVVIDFQAKQ
jgi:hypothetical protein